MRKQLTVSVYDNETSIDRITVVIEVGQLKDFYGMSLNATVFNQYCGSNHEGYKKGKHLGKSIGWEGCSDELKVAIIERLKGY